MPLQINLFFLHFQLSRDNVNAPARFAYGFHS